MAGSIKPIQTKYNGYLFRSRLEARWAVFYDALGIEYEYEKEGYDLGDLGWYLPDFYLPGYGWVEIKGLEPTIGDIIGKKCQALAKATKTPTYLFYGGIKLPNQDEYPQPNSCYAFIDISGMGNYGYDWPFNWCQCYCGKRTGIEYDGRGGRLGCSCTHGDDKAYNTDSSALMNACETAMSYRF